MQDALRLNFVISASLFKADKKAINSSLILVPFVTNQIGRCFLISLLHTLQIHNRQTVYDIHSLCKLNLQMYVKYVFQRKYYFDRIEVKTIN